MKLSLKGSPRRVAVVGLLAVVGIAVLGVAAATGALQGAPPQKNVFRAGSRRRPGSGKGIVIGYATSLEAVPIVHVISEGIKAQAKRAGVKLIFCDTGGDLTKALDCAKSMKTQGVAGHPAVPARHEGLAVDLQGRPAGRAGRSRSTSRSRRARRRSWASTTPTAASSPARRPARRSRRSGTASTTPGSRSSSRRSAQPNEQRMGGYRKGFQSVCPGAIKNLKKVGFDATLDKARTLMTDVLTTLPGQAPHHRRVDRRRGHRGRVRRGEVGRPAERRLRHLARRRRQGRQVRHQDEPELARLDGDLARRSTAGRRSRR